MPLQTCVDEHEVAYQATPLDVARSRISTYQDVSRPREESRWTTFHGLTRLSVWTLTCKVGAPAPMGNRWLQKFRSSRLTRIHTLYISAIARAAISPCIFVVPLRVRLHPSRRDRRSQTKGLVRSAISAADHTCIQITAKTPSSSWCSRHIFSL
jgi:hypothetical protein